MFHSPSIPGRWLCVLLLVLAMLSLPAGADAARAIADYHKSRKAEVTTALYDLGNAIYGYHLLLELASLFVALHPIFLLLSFIFIYNQFCIFT